MPKAEPTDDVSFQVDLRVHREPGGGVFRAVLEVKSVDLSVEAVSADVDDAMRAAAERCAEKLGRLGYCVTAREVLGALDEVVEPTSAASASLPS